MTKTTCLLLTFFCHLNFLSAQLFEEALTYAEQMPYFPGCVEYEDDSSKKRQCSNQRLVRYIAQNVVYPQAARDAEIEGTVYVSFVVDVTGEILKPSVLMDIGGGCGDAALQVIEDMPKWEAGIHEGQKVKVKLNLPVHFSLRTLEPDLTDSYHLTWGGVKGNRLTISELESNVNEEILVRDPLGEVLDVSELTFVFERKNKVLSGKSRGTISEELQKVIQKAKKGGKLTILALIQDAGEFVYVSREFELH